VCPDDAIHIGGGKGVCLYPKALRTKSPSEEVITRDSTSENSAIVSTRNEIKNRCGGILIGRVVKEEIISQCQNQRSPKIMTDWQLKNRTLESAYLIFGRYTHLVKKGQFFSRCAEGDAKKKCDRIRIAPSRPKSHRKCTISNCECMGVGEEDEAETIQGESKGTRRRTKLEGTKLPMCIWRVKKRF